MGRGGANRIFCDIKGQSYWGLPPQSDSHSPLHQAVVRTHPSGKQVAPVAEQLVVMAAVPHPHVGYTGHAARQTQQILPCAAVLVRDEDALIGRATLGMGQ